MEYMKDGEDSEAMSLLIPPTEVPPVVLIPTLLEAGYSSDDNPCASRLWSQADLGLNPGSSVY